MRKYILITLGVFMGLAIGIIFSEWRVKDKIHTGQYYGEIDAKSKIAKKLSQHFQEIDFVDLPSTAVLLFSVKTTDIYIITGPDGTKSIQIVP